jgi:hypothetical protein
MEADGKQHTGQQGTKSHSAGNTPERIEKCKKTTDGRVLSKAPSVRSEPVYDLAGS